MRGHTGAQSTGARHAFPPPHLPPPRPPPRQGLRCRWNPDDYWPPLGRRDAVSGMDAPMPLPTSFAPSLDLPPPLRPAPVRSGAPSRPSSLLLACPCCFSPPFKLPPAPCSRSWRSCSGREARTQRRAPPLVLALLLRGCWPLLLGPPSTTPLRPALARGGAAQDAKHGDRGRHRLWCWCCWPLLLALPPCSSAAPPGSRVAVPLTRNAAREETRDGPEPGMNRGGGTVRALNE